MVSGPIWSSGTPNLRADLDMKEDGTAFRLQILQDSSGGISETDLLLAVVYHARSWNLFGYSNLDNGDFPKTKVLQRDALGCDDSGSCGFRETLRITLPSSLLGQSKSTGFQVRLSGENGSAEVVVVSGLYVQGFAMGVLRIASPQPGAATSGAAPSASTTIPKANP